MKSSFSTRGKPRILSVSGVDKKELKKKQQQSNQHNDEHTSKRDKKQLGFCERLNGKNSMLFLQKNEKERNWTQWASDFMQIKKELPAMLKNQQWLCLTQIFREKAGSKKREKNISMDLSLSIISQQQLLSGHAFLFKHLKHLQDT